MPCHRAIAGFIFVCVAALAVTGCKNSAQIFEDQNDGGWFSKKMDVFAKPDWARPTGATVNLGPQGPVSPEEFVSADGRCAAPTAALAQAGEQAPAQQTDAPGGTKPAGQASADPGQRLGPSNSAPLVPGGIGLGMTECQAVQRAGTPSNVAISSGDKGERKVVLTYLSGPWPGIYTFDDGRLKVIDRAPEQAKPAKSAPQKKKPAKPKTASHEFERSYVQ